MEAHSVCLSFPQFGRALKPNRGNKTYFSRLTRWVDKLLPFDFDINHKPGSKMGIVDYLSRHPTGQAIPISHYDKQFVLATINKCRRDLRLHRLRQWNSPKSTRHSPLFDRFAPHFCVSRTHKTDQSARTTQEIYQIDWSKFEQHTKKTLTRLAFQHLHSFDFNKPYIKPLLKF